MLTKIVAGLVMLSVLVVVHELGHFLVARLFRIAVPVFSIGMGPRLFGFRLGETDYRISAIPVGGYVQLAGADPFGGDDPDDDVPDEHRFEKKPIWQRLLVMFAGPGSNLLLPFVVFTGVLMAGEPQPDAHVGLVHPDSVAEQVGFEPGDRIVAVEGRPVDAWIELQMRLESGLTGDVDVMVDRGGREVALTVPASALEFDEEGWIDLESLGVAWRAISTRVGIDDPTSPAARAGLKTGDGILSVDGVAVETWTELERALSTGDRHEVAWRRADGDRIVEGTATLQADPLWSARPGERWDARFGLAPIMLFVRGFTDDSAAREAGVQLDDRLLAVDGTPVVGWWDLVDLVGAATPPPVENASGGCGGDEIVAEARSLRLSVVRAGQVVELDFRPRMRREVIRTTIFYRPLIGVVQDPNAWVTGALVEKRYSVGQAVSRASQEVGAVFKGTLTVLAQMFTGDRKVKESLGGPVAIFTLAGESAERSWFEFVRLLGGISIGLGVVNLLPVPVLDGGHILFYGLEWVRGRPLSLRLRERIQMIGVLMLVALVLVVTFNDITGVLGG